MSEHKLAPGDKAPDFTLPDADGKPVSLSSLRGQQVIVYFYPAAMTPGCTTEACDFRDCLSSLAAAGVTSGFDLALWLAEKHFGAERADDVARGISYRRDRNVWRARAQR